MVGPSGEVVGEAEQATEQASSWAVAHVEKGRRGREVGWAGFGSRPKEREGRKRKRKAFSIFYFTNLSQIQTRFEFKPPNTIPALKQNTVH